MMGAGGVARSLATALRQAGYNIRQVYSHTAKSANDLAGMVGAEAITDVSDITDTADFYIYCLKDDVLAEVAGWNLPFKSGMHVHTSGTLPMNIFAPTGCKSYGSLYPFQSFSRDRIISFDEVPLFIKANNRLSYAKLNCLAETISNNVYHNKIKNMLALHVAGIFANNFTNAMVRVAYDLLRDARIPVEVLIPMVRESADKVLDIGPVAAQSGPASRGDVHVVNTHLDYLAEKPDVQQIYRLVSEYILDNRPTKQK